MRESVFTRVGRWLWTGSPDKPETPRICDLCARDHHVHDANNGRCLYQWCKCDRGTS